MNPNLNTVETQEQTAKRGVFESSDLLGNRTPIQVAKEIRKALGQNTTCRTVGYTINVKSTMPKAREIAQEVYHRQHHQWLIVRVNGSCLPMPNVELSQPAKKI